MRGSRWFIFFVLAFLLLMFAIEYHLPKKFVWVPTFSHTMSSLSDALCSTVC